MNTWQQEQETKIALQNEVLFNLAAKLKEPLTKEGFTIELSNLTQLGSETDFQRIVILDPSLPMFRAEIFGASWAGKGKASFSVETSHTVVKEIKNYYKHDGSSNWEHTKYEFTRYVTDDTLKELGLERINYQVSLDQLRSSFKADKNIKLILNDILPKLKIYREVIKLAGPKILSRIAEENSTLELQKQVAMKSAHHYVPSKLGNYNFTMPDKSKISISEYGTITIEREVSAEELKIMLGIK